jgi:hypothetical protein
VVRQSLVLAVAGSVAGLAGAVVCASLLFLFEVRPFDPITFCVVPVLMLLLGDFHHHTWSCELGIAKPDPAIYTYTCEKLDVAPAEALFLDDKAENIRAAKEVGLVGIQFKNIEQLQRDLETRGLLDEVVLPLA